MSFIPISFFDVLDVFLVAYLLYQLYMLMKGTVAISIFAGFATFYLIWLLVRVLNMELLSLILGQFIGIGVIALVIVFQQEVRTFLLMIGSRYFNNRKFSLDKIMSLFIKKQGSKLKIDTIVLACKKMSKSKTGALIAIVNKSGLENYANTGDIIDAITSSRLLETIFFKNTPLHDGAVIIVDDKVYAARCVLPVSHNENIPPSLGLRHRAALGLAEATDAFVIVVSEETGNISFTHHGELHINITTVELKQKLKDEFFPDAVKVNSWKIATADVKSYMF